MKLNIKIIRIIILLGIGVIIIGYFVAADRISDFIFQYISPPSYEQPGPPPPSYEQPGPQREYKKERLFSYLDYIPDLPTSEYWLFSNLRFSPDGKHFALYPFRDPLSGKSILIVDGKRLGSYEEFPGDEVEALIKFSPNSKEIAYVAPTNGKTFVVWNNQPGEQYQEAGYILGDSSIIRLFLEFSPDSKHLAYGVREGNNNSFIVFDGKEGKHYDDIDTFSGIAFSPDSKHFAYVAIEGCVFEVIGYTGDRGHCYGGKSFIVKDGVEESEKHDDIYILKFSPDSTQIAYAGEDGCPRSRGQGRWCDVEPEHFIAFQGKKINVTDSVLSLEISSKNELAYVLANGVIWWAGKSKEYPSSNIPLMKFSPDGNHFAYFVFEKDGGNNFIVVDGQEKELFYYPYDSQPPVLPAFSSDLKHFAYVGLNSATGQPMVILDNHPSKLSQKMEFEEIRNLHFSDDGNFFFYNARSGPDWYYIEESVE